MPRGSQHGSRFVLALSLLLMAAACSGEPSAASVRKRGVDLPVLPENKPLASPSNTQPTLEPIAVDEPPPQQAAAEPVMPAEEAAPDQDERPPRNLQNELETMLGSPANCLTPRDAKDAPSQVQISLSASVMPSGAVGRGEVTAPGLSAEEILCVRARLESLRFAQPIENAPLTVNGTITLNRGS